MKSYKQMSYQELLDMSYQELLDEEVRVKVLLATNKHPFTQKQNRAYLSKIQKEITTYLKFKGATS